MGMFGCKHKKIIITFCETNSRYFICKCVKCGKLVNKPKAIGETYQIGMIISN